MAFNSVDNISGTYIKKKKVTGSESQVELARNIESPAACESTVENVRSALADFETQLIPLDLMGKGGGGVQKVIYFPFQNLKNKEELKR